MARIAEGHVKKRIAEGAYNALSQTLSMQGTYHYVMT
jgi:hypothetical protein